ncbi:DUF1217 domain-containing protein [Mesorhizobium sp. NBSH29]|uniref:DUF1217 domain-containing protein n=1 Tax=Mesorhizobium sp. NBSH29 TaxID=2654249 RepID=UPI0018964688|nr:DUF1217 domain-containing protein [Mesorhizobium sp. NBSH29]QPC85381.1 DUF1217 domain-containing protein [Mesorhizobium sp. NBSH29]
MLNTYTSYQLIARDIAKSIDRVEAQPVVKRDTEYYLDNITKVKSIEDFLKDDRLFKYAMKAHGLEDMSYAKAFIKKALKEGIDDSDSFANKLSDKRYRDFVTTFNFARHGNTATIFARAQKGTAEKYLRQTLEENAGKQNEGVRLALYFERKGPAITSFYDVLADPALSRVVRTALGLPDSFAAADIDRQAKLFEEKLNIEDFKNPQKLGTFLKRFTSLWELSNPTSTTQASLGILFGQPVEFGVSTNVLLAIQQMKR